MTKHKSFKRLVRARMHKTGESYTAARAKLLAAEDPRGADQPVLAASDATIRRRTGRGWEAWFDLLDERGAAELAHREIARTVAEQLDIAPLGWDAQAITVSYERARRGRAVGERPDGFAITTSKTIAAPVEQLFDAIVDTSSREHWLTDGRLRERAATRPTAARFDWADGTTRVTITFDAKGETKSTATIEHTRLADADQADRMKAYWRARLNELSSQLERGGLDA